MRLLGAGLAMAGGMVLAGQVRLNGELGHELNDGVLAATVSFSVGLLILGTLVLVVPGALPGVRRLRSGDLRWWHYLGGLAGAFFVTTQGLTVAALGVAVFSVAVVAGQVVSSLIVDHAGLGPGGVRAVTAPRLTGAVLAVLAVGVAVSGRFGDPAQLWLALLPALGGVGLGWQQAVNGLVRAESGSVLVATATNFATGTVALVAVATVDVLARGLPASWPSQWWLYAGGALGTLAISSAVFAVRSIGVLLVGMCAVAGQVLGALLLDLVVPVAGTVVDPATVVGVLVTLAAVGIAALPTRAAMRG